MKSCQWMIVVVLWASMVCLVGGCGRDPQIKVTPFVLKPCVAQPVEAEPSGALAMGTRPYEEAIAGGASARK